MRQSEAGERGGSVDTITQLVTVGAVVVGALTTYVTNYLMERSKRRAQLLTRWDEKKLDAYADYVGSVRTSIYAAVLLYEVREDIRSLARTEHELTEDLTQVTGEQALAFERVMLLAGEPVIDAAHAVQGAAHAVMWQARSVVDGTLEDWRALNAEAFRAINQFHECARVDLGVSGGFLGEQHSARGLLLPEARRQSDA